MRKLFFALVCVLLLAGSLFAQANISSKATFTYNTMTFCANSTGTPATFACQDSSGEGKWQLVGVPLNVKTSNPTDIFMSVSLVTGLYTKTQVKGNTAGSQTASGSTAVAQGTVQVKVTVDDTDPDGAPSLAVIPQGADGVTFDNRIQTLNASIGNIFTDCFANKVNTGSAATCDIIPEQITLILDTAAAHSFHFAMVNVGQGVHTLRVFARVSTSTTGTDPGNVAVANAAFGLGSVTVEAVKLLDPTSGAYLQ